MIDIKSVYWLAGILEGEGYFGYSQTPQIQLTMTDRDIINRVKLIYNTDINIRINDDPRKESYKRQYNLNINGALAVQWMQTIYPLMGIRRKGQILEVLSKWKAMPNRSSNDFCKHGHPLTERNTLINYNSNGTAMLICRQCKLSNSRRRWKAKYGLITA